MNGAPASVARLWLISVALSISLLLVLGWMWYAADTAYQTDPNQMDDACAVERALEHYAVENSQVRDQPPIYVPTGLYVQSLKFETEADVLVTGFIWQKYRSTLPDGLSRRFVLPEAIESLHVFAPRQIYRKRNGDHEIVIWYFEASLRQEFDYLQYPLDHKTVRIRLRHPDFDQNVVLVPDLESYDSTQLGTTFGFDRKMVLDEWSIDETYYSYYWIDYDTNFGIPNFVGQHAFPELNFSIVIHRKFLHAFFNNLVPIVVSAVVLFMLMLTVTQKKRLKARLGFNMFAVLGTGAAVFFVIMLAHIDARNQIPGASIVYLEQFYLLMYFVIVAVMANAYMVSVRLPLRVIQYHDNLLPKIAYWPLILGAMVVITYSSLH